MGGGREPGRRPNQWSISTASRVPYDSRFSRLRFAGRSGRGRGRVGLLCGTAAVLRTVVGAAQLIAEASVDVGMLVRSPAPSYCLPPAFVWGRVVSRVATLIALVCWSVLRFCACTMNAEDGVNLWSVFQSEMHEALYPIG